MLARIVDSGKLNPATVMVPLLPEVDGEPPPDDPQALAIRLSPRIEDSRARNAQRGIGNPPELVPARWPALALWGRVSPRSPDVTISTIRNVPRTAVRVNGIRSPARPAAPSAARRGRGRRRPRSGARPA